MAESSLSQLVWQSAAGFLTAPYRRQDGGLSSQVEIGAPHFATTGGSFHDRLSAFSSASLGAWDASVSSNNPLTIAQSIPADAQRFDDKPTFDSIESEATPSPWADDLISGQAFDANGSSDNPLDSAHSSQVAGAAGPATNTRDQGARRQDAGESRHRHEGSSSESSTQTGDRSAATESESSAGRGSQQEGNADRRSADDADRRDRHDRSSKRSERDGGDRAVNAAHAPSADTAARSAKNAAHRSSSGQATTANSATTASANASARVGSGAAHSFDITGSRAAPESLAGRSTSASSGASKGNATQSGQSTQQSTTGARADRSEQPTFVRSIMTLSRTNGGAMTMKLEPESLGSLRIQMSMNHGRVSIQFHTQNAEAGALIRNSVESLRTSLESQGLRLENVTIQPLSREAASGHGSQHSPSDQGTHQGHERQDASDGRSRGYSNANGGRDSSNQSGADGRHDERARQANASRPFNIPGDDDAI